VDELPASGVALAALEIDAAWHQVVPVAGNALARTALDATELLHVDVDQLARSLALVAMRRLKSQTA
jgi:hypothetical protein